MVLPHQLGLSTTSKGNAAKPDASCTKQDLEGEQGEGDQAKGLRNEMDSVSMLHQGGKVHVQHARM